MNALFKAGAAILYVSSLCLPALAQRPARTSPIQLDVVVTDKSGKPVPGLRQQDFTVLDNKRQANILSVQAHNAADVPPGKLDPSTEVIFVYDEVNTTYEKNIYARQGLENFLKENHGQLDHPVSIALFTDKGLQMQTQPSIDGNAMADALEREGQTYRAIDNGSVGGDFERLQLSLNAVDTLIEQEGPKPGRKMVIWISPGWPLISGPRDTLTTKQQQYILDTAVRLSTDLRRARITFYSVDPRGAGGTGERSVFYQNFTDGLTKLDNAAFGDLGLQVLVTQTGGRAIFGNDPIAVSINHVVDDLNAYYTLEVEATQSDRPNQYHDLSIKLATPGLKARTRTGYYAQP